MFICITFVSIVSETQAPEFVKELEGAFVEQGSDHEISFVVSGLFYILYFLTVFVQI